MKRIIPVMISLVFIILLAACAAEIDKRTDAEQDKVSEGQHEADISGTTDMTDESSLMQKEAENMTIGVFDFEKRSVLLNSGYEMPIMGLGTYALDYETCVNSVKALLENGGKLIDTAYMYHNEDVYCKG